MGGRVLGEESPQLMAGAPRSGAVPGCRCPACSRQHGALSAGARQDLVELMGGFLPPSHFSLLLPHRLVSGFPSTTPILLLPLGS